MRSSMFWTRLGVLAWIAALSAPAIAQQGTAEDDKGNKKVESVDTETKKEVQVEVKVLTDLEGLEGLEEELPKQIVDQIRAAIGQVKKSTGDGESDKNGDASTKTKSRMTFRLGNGIVLPGGDISGIRILRSSGDGKTEAIVEGDLDEVVRKQIDKAMAQLDGAIGTTEDSVIKVIRGLDMDGLEIDGKTTVAGKVVIVGPDGEPQTYEWNGEGGMEDGELDAMLEELPEGVLKTLKAARERAGEAAGGDDKSSKVLRFFQRDKKAAKETSSIESKLDAILERLGQLEADVQELKKSRADGSAKRQQ